MPFGSGSCTRMPSIAASRFSASHPLEHRCLAQRGGQLVLDGVHADALAGAPLALDVGGAGRVVAHQHDGEARRAASGGAKRPTSSASSSRISLARARPSTTSVGRGDWLMSARQDRADGYAAAFEPLLLPACPRASSSAWDRWAASALAARRGGGSALAGRIGFRGGRVGLGLAGIRLGLRRIEVRVPAAALQHEGGLRDQPLDLARAAERAGLERRSVMRCSASNSWPHFSQAYS